MTGVNAPAKADDKAPAAGLPRETIDTFSSPKTATSSRRVESAVNRQ